LHTYEHGRRFSAPCALHQSKIAAARQEHRAQPGLPRRAGYRGISEYLDLDERQVAGILGAIASPAGRGRTAGVETGSDE
jgi:hypothetical protein